MKTVLDEIKGIVASLEEDVVKFTEKGNQTSGTRIRLAMQKVKVLAQDVRLKVQVQRDEIKKTRAAAKVAKAA